MTQEQGKNEGKIDLVVEVYKKRGETPLACIERFRSEHPQYQKEKMSYLGRLDPMAEGVMLVAIGKANKQREKYLGLPKEYEFEVLFGFSTDTGDLLGIVTNQKDISLANNEIEENAFLASLVGKHSQKYPAYSSKTINGVPMWVMSREGALDEKEVPTKEIEIYSIKSLGNQKIGKEFLLEEILKKIREVKGDFRQAEIIHSWINSFSATNEKEFKLAKYKLTCSSGTYVRSVVERISKSIALPAVTYSIKRTKIEYI